MVDPVFDYSKLRGKIKEVFGTQDAYANAIGLGRVAVSMRLNNQLEFSQQEMFKRAGRSLQAHWLRAQHVAEIGAAKEDRVVYRRGKAAISRTRAG